MSDGTVPARIDLPGDGIMLAGDAAGPVDAAPILFLHGGGQTRHSWRRALLATAARGHRAIALDLRGHGDSGWPPDGDYAIERFVADIAAAIAHLAKPPIIVGASLGGIAGLLLSAGPYPRPRGLVLVDIAPRIEPEGAREVIGFMASAPDGFASIEAAADAVAAYLPHRPRPADTGGLARNLRLRNGRYHWHWDPRFGAMSRAAPDDAAMNPLVAAARALAIPTLLIRGGRSRIVSPEGAREFLELVPHAGFVDIAGADHMVAGDANDAFNTAVLAFIDQQGAA